MKSWLLFTFLVLVSCQKDQRKEPETQTYDPFNITDIFEREIRKDCSDQVISDKIERRAAVGQHKLNPVKNIPIEGATFTNIDTGAVFIPNTAFPGPGGDNKKLVSFCQLPFVSSCNMIANPGDNRIEYKYVTYLKKPCPNDPNKQCTEEYIQEEGLRTFHFTVGQVHSDKTCTRKPTTCPTTTNAISWGACQY